MQSSMKTLFALSDRNRMYHQLLKLKNRRPHLWANILLTIFNKYVSWHLIWKICYDFQYFYFENEVQVWGNRWIFSRASLLGLSCYAKLCLQSLTITLDTLKDLIAACYFALYVIFEYIRIIRSVNFFIFN